MQINKQMNKQMLWTSSQKWNLQTSHQASEKTNLQANWYSTNNSYQNTNKKQTRKPTNNQINILYKPIGKTETNI